jgi:hypothetical protein
MIKTPNAAVSKALKRLHYPLDIMLTCVRWYVAYPLSLRHLEEMMSERAVSVDHSTVHRWAIKLLPALGKAFKLLYRIGQHCERYRDWALALASYANCTYPGARHRRMRVLEQCGRDSEALDLALGAHHTPESEEEGQRMRRMLPRLRRKLGLANETVCKPAAPERGDLVLGRPPEHVPIEIAVRDALGQPDDHAVSVYYVENALLNSLFGLLALLGRDFRRRARCILPSVPARPRPSVLAQLLRCPARSIRTMPGKI